MDLDKIIKWVWLSIGAIVLVTIIFVFVGFLWQAVVDTRSSDSSGVALDNAQKENQERITLGLRYGYPLEIGNTTNYLIEVSVDYKDSDRRMGSYGKDFDVDQPSNIIFTDKSFVPIRKLLDQKGLIIDYDYPGQGNDYSFASDEPSGTKYPQDWKHIAYQIALTDTDRDGQLTGADASDVYISDLDGGNMVKVSTGWVIDEYKFMHDYTELLIGYYEPADEKKEELRFAVYSIGNQKLTALDPLKAVIDEAKNILRK